MWCKLLALLVFLSFLVYGLKFIYSFFVMVPQLWDYSKSWVMFYIPATIIYVFLNLMAAYGLFFIKKWGFAFAYTAILFNTFFLALPSIPFIGKIITGLFSIGNPAITLIIINLMVMGFVAYLHREFLRNK